MKLYELREKDSAQTYYKITRQLAECLQEQMSVLEQYIMTYASYLSEHPTKNSVTRVECGIELLCFAILHRWICHMKTSDGYDLQRVTYAELTESIAFMEASGEFREELLKFKSWMHFFENLTEPVWQDMWSRIHIVVEWIDKLGGQHLERYLPQLEEYRNKNMHEWESRQDAAFILRDKSCYYVNMIGAQMLNRCYREAFLTCEKTYIFLPGCMAQNGSFCKAVGSSDGYICQDCMENCQINRMSKRYPHVRILYHGSEMEKRQAPIGRKTGVVGVSCILNLIAGGWKARRLGYVPQCVLLNECGCRTHWSEVGSITSLDENELDWIMESMG